MRIVCRYLSIIVLLFLFSCHDKSQEQQKRNTNVLKESMETANRYLVNAEEEDIDRYVSRHGLKMNCTGTGLRYVILKQGSDSTIDEGQTVVMEYDLCFITGDVIYSSDKEGYKVFKVGDGQVESGLDEAMKYLHRGDIATLILPSHLGYGLHGDDKDIPAYSTLVYKIKIIDIQ